MVIELRRKMNKLATVVNSKGLIYIAIVILMILGFAMRTYKIDNPVADWHSWRQADTAAVSRNFIKDGFTPFFPRFDSLNPLNETGQPNPERYFFAEFPLYNIITYFFYSNFGVNEVYARLVSITFAVLTIPTLFFLTSHFSNRRIALFASAIFALLPYNVFYGRVIMADPMHIFFSVLTLLLVVKWLSKDWILLGIAAGIAGTCAILAKPYALVLILPISYLFYQKWGAKMFAQWRMYLFLAITIIPFILWRSHITQYPEGMFGTTWLYNQGNIRFTGAYFRWLIFDRMNRLIFATGGFALFWMGLIVGHTKKEGYFYYLWLASILAFFVVIAKGNVTHDYYQLPLVPIGCIFIAKAIDFLIISGQGFLNRGLRIGVALVLVAVMFSFGWYEVRGYYNINHPEIVEAGKAVDKLTPKDALVIAPYDNDSAFLYQTNRHGFTFGGDKIPQYISEGATHLVSTNYDETTNMWMEKCNIVSKTEKYVILDLKNCSEDLVEK